MKPKTRKPSKPSAQDAAAVGEAIVAKIAAKWPEPVKVKVKDVVNTDVSICYKARILAASDAQTRANEAATKEQMFMDSLFASRAQNNRSQYVNHGDHTYTICGLRWMYEDQINGLCRLSVIHNHPDNQYRTTWIFGGWDDSTSCQTLAQLGAVLLRRDAHVEFIDRTYPNTFWGRIRLWFNYHIV